jgi:D-glycero-D-manno-heptose 1,7-bisphosphate phosphatase
MISKNLSQAVILAGGLGQRLKPITDKLPKPMIDINGSPFISYLLNFLSSEGIEDVIILSGYKSKVLEDYVGDGSSFGVNVIFSKLDSKAQTSERIFNSSPLLNDVFLLMYCDNFIPLNLSDMTKKYYDSNKLAQISVYTNKYSMTKNNLLYSQKELIKYDKKRTDNNLNGVNIGYMILNKSIIKLLQSTQIDFESVILPNLIKNKQVACYLTDHKYYSIGSKERLPTTKKYFQKEKYILLDRDGVLNKKMPKAKYVTNWNEWEWKKGSLEALKILNKNDYKVIIISNQPGISRGFMTEQDLEIIHSNMKKDAIKAGGQIESIYVCKCNWDDGCDCRKPKPGMIYNAQYDNDFILSETYLLGDDERDMEAAKKAGCKGILIRENDRLDNVVKKLLGNSKCSNI